MGRSPHLLRFFLTTSLLFTNSVFPGTSGKITGIVTDADNGVPMAGVNVILQNTSLGAVSDSQGRFTILNIVPG
ncbi:uncharacterized protein METZ01_LOCUS249456, partial [marine metagenome]